MDRNFEIPSFPVAFVNKPLLYVCEAFVNSDIRCVRTFDVQSSPTFGRY